MKEKNKNTKEDKKPLQSTKTDPLGSWTGTPEDPYDVPVQDVDDL